MAAPIRVLHIEDNEDEAFLVQAALLKAGLPLQIERASSVAAAEAVFQPGRFDLVLADFHLGDADGFRALEIVRGRDREIPFVVVSGAIGEEQAVAMLRSGANDYVMKDRLLRLAPVIRRELDEYQQRRRRERTLRHNGMHHAVVTILANASSLIDALLEILPVVGNNSGWDFARIAMVDAFREALGARVIWSAPDTFALRADKTDSNFPEAVRRTRTFPIRNGEDTFGVLELGTKSAEELEDDLAATLTSICLEVGQASARERALLRLSTSEARHKLLADASGMLMQSIENIHAVENIARRLLPELGDWCEIDFRAEDGSLRRAAAAHLDPEKDQLFHTAPNAGDAAPLAEWLGAPELITDKGEEHLRGLAPGDARMSLLRKLGARSLICVPLIAPKAPPRRPDRPDVPRDPTIGVLVLGRAPGGEQLGESEAFTAREIARRLATAVENARLYREVEESLRARDEFLTVAAHELKTPLTPLRVNIGSLLRLLDGSKEEALEPDRLQARLQRLDHISERLTRLVEHLLDVSRLTVGRFSLSLERFDLETLLTESVGHLAEEIDRSGCKIEWKLPGQPVIGSWDKRRMAVVIRSAVSNALKFGAGCPIEIELSSEGETVRLVFRDHGPGMSEASQRAAFERFARGVSIRNYGGFGLGLWVVHEIIEGHGGTVSLSNAPGGGARLEILLPREARPSSTPRT